MSMMLHELIEVRETSTAGVFDALVDITDIQGRRYVTSYGVVPGDTHGLGPAIREAVEDWIEAGNAPTPYVPPTPEEIRASLPPLSARQLRLGLIANG
ncbi:hypothetical protein RZ532_23380, partial [Nitratireductor aquimarinus]|nr:hypothetical protein [Nitratireductor aquimarinus]